MIREGDIGSGARHPREPRSGLSEIPRTRRLAERHERGSRGRTARLGDRAATGRTSPPARRGIALDPQEGEIEFDGNVRPPAPSLAGFRGALTQKARYLEHFWPQFANSLHIGLLTMLLTVQVSWRIYLPLMKPALAVAALFALLVAWNDCVYQFVLLSSERNTTLSMVQAQLFGDTDPPWNAMMASAVLYALPPSRSFSPCAAPS